jgi:hypothetical protein
MKFNKWTLGLAAVGVVSLASAARADEKMSQVQTALSNTTLSGYVDTSAMWNTGTQAGATTGTPVGGQLPPYTPGLTHGDGFNLNSVDIALDKPLDATAWAAGYHAELMFGQDSVGEQISSSGQTATIRNAYVVLSTPIADTSISWKMGVWDSPIGYESSSRPTNPNFTTSYGWFVEPTTFTGILGTYKVNDALTFQAGFANASPGNASNGNFPGTSTVPYETQKAYMGTVALTAPDSWGWMKGATLNAGFIIADNGSAGSTGFSGTGRGATWMYVGGMIPTPVQALKFGAAFDYVDFHNGGVTGNPSDDSIWVFGGYGTYQFNDKLSLNLRVENYSATSSSVLTTTPSGGFVPAAGHNAQELTATLQYQLWQNVVSRLELRWDKAYAKAWDNSQTTVGPVHKNEFLLAVNVAYQF